MVGQAVVGQTMVGRAVVGQTMVGRARVPRRTRRPGRTWRSWSSRLPRNPWRSRFPWGPRRTRRRREHHRFLRLPNRFVGHCTRSGLLLVKLPYHACMGTRADMALISLYSTSAQLTTFHHARM